MPVNCQAHFRLCVFLMHGTKRWATQSVESCKLSCHPNYALHKNPQTHKIQPPAPPPPGRVGAEPAFGPGCSHCIMFCAAGAAPAYSSVSAPVRATPTQAMVRMLSDVTAAAGLETRCTPSAVQQDGAAASTCGVPDAQLEVAVALSSVFSAPALALLLRQPQSTRDEEVMRLGRVVLGEPVKSAAVCEVDCVGRVAQAEARRVGRLVRWVLSERACCSRDMLVM